MSISWKSTNPTDDWNVAIEWSGGAVAGSGDDVVFGTGANSPYTVTVTNANEAAKSVSITSTSATLSITGAHTLTVTNAFSNKGTVLVDATAGDGGGTLSVGTNFTNFGTATFGNSTAASAVTVNVTGSLINNSGATMTLAGGSGATTVTVGGAISNGGTLSVNSGGVLSLAAGKTFSQNTTTAATTIAGSLTETATSTVDIEGGTFADTGTFTNSGTFKVAGNNGASASFLGGNLTNFSAGALTGGTWFVGPDSTLTLPDNAGNGLTAIGDGSTATTVTLNGTASSLLSGAVTAEASLGSVAAAATLNLTGGRAFAGTTAAVGGLTVGGTVVVDATSSLSETGGITVSGTLKNAGTVGSAVSVNGGTVVLTPGYSFGSTVTDTGGNSTLELANGGTAGNTVSLGTTSLGGTAGAFNNFHAVKVDTNAKWEVDVEDLGVLTGATGFITGSNGVNTLVMNAAGVVDLSKVKGFPIVDLADGGLTGNTVTVVDTTLSLGNLTINGTGSHDTIDASGTSASSAGRFLTVNLAGTGDTFTGGRERDTVTGAATAITGNALHGSTGANTLTATTAGTLDLSNVSRFPTINLADGNNGAGSNVTLSNTTFTGLTVRMLDHGTGSGSSATSGVNTIDATGVAAVAGKTLTLVYFAGTEALTYLGGAENDTLSIGADAVTASATATTPLSIDGGTGSDQLLLTSSGTVDLSSVGHFDTIRLFSTGSNDVTLSGTTLAGSGATAPVALFEGNGGNTVTVDNATGPVPTSSEKLIYVTGTGTDVFTGGDETDVVRVRAANLIGAETLDGGTTSATSATNNTLQLVSAGTVNLSQVKHFQNITLTGSSNTVTVTDTTLSDTANGGAGAAPVTISGGTSNTVDASTATGGVGGTERLIYKASGGTDHFTGGGEIDVVQVAASRVGADTLDGGAGTFDTLKMTTSGTFSLSSVSNFETVLLANGNNTVTAAVTGAETITGGVGINDLKVSNTGSINLNNVSGFQTIDLTGAPSGADRSVTLDDTTLGVVSFSGSISLNKLTTTASLNIGSIISGSGIASGTKVTGLTTGGYTVSISQTVGTESMSAYLPLTIKDGGGASPNSNAVSSSGTTGSLTYSTTLAGDNFTGGGEDDTVQVSIANLISTGEALSGGSGGNDALTLTDAGSLALGAVGASNFGTLNLAAGSSSITASDLSAFGGTLTIADGTSGSNLIDASGNTTNTTGVLTYKAGTGSGSDYFQGGAEQDIVSVSAAKLAFDTFIGGSNAGNTLSLTNAGTFNLNGVRNFGAIDLAAGNSSVTVTAGTLFGSSSSAPVTISDGASGNNIVSVFGASGQGLTYVIGAGSDHITVGSESDTLSFTSSTGAQTITGFDPIHSNPSNGDKLSFSAAAFNFSGTSGTQMSSSLIKLGSFDNTTERFAYNSSTGVLQFDADGNGGSSTTKTIATLVGHPALTAADFFVS